MKFLMQLGTFILLVSLALNLKAQTLITNVPVVQLIAASLVEGTQLKSHFLPPDALPMNRIPNWQSRMDPSQIPEAEAVLTIESIRSAWSLYPWVRQQHLRSVPIDIAQELAPGGARVVLQPNLHDEYFWLDFNNLVLMLNLAAKDLKRLWPDETQIERNRAQQIRQIQETQYALETLLFEAGVTGVTLEDPRLMPFAHTLGLPLLSDPAPGSIHLTTRAPGESAGWVWQINPLLRVEEAGLQGWLTHLPEHLKQSLLLSTRSALDP